MNVVFRRKCSFPIGNSFILHRTLIYDREKCGRFRSNGAIRGSWAGVGVLDFGKGSNVIILKDVFLFLDDILFSIELVGILSNNSHT